MKSSIVLSISLATLAGVATGLVATAEAQSLPKPTRLERFTPHKPPANEGPAGYFYIEGITKPVQIKVGTSEAKTGFDNLTNGFAAQGPDFNTLNADNVVPMRSFNDGRFLFEEVETFTDGL